MNIFANVQETSTKKRTKLEGDKIHTVYFSGIEIVETESEQHGKSRAVDIYFTDENGLTHNDRIYEPKSNTREVRTSSNGGEYTAASDVDKFAAKIKLYADTFSPMMKRCISEGKAVYTNWIAFSNLLIKCFERDVQTGMTDANKFQLKLSKNNKGWATINFYCSINSSGEVYVSKANSIVGEELMFSEYELKKIKERAAIKPTSMKRMVASDDSSSDSDFGFMSEADDASNLTEAKNKLIASSSDDDDDSLPF